MADFEKFQEHVRAELAPNMMKSAFCCLIVPSSPEAVDAKMCIELGMMVLFDKTIIAVVQPGTEVPAKLVAIADRIVEFSGDDADCARRIREAVEDLMGAKSTGP